MADRYLTLYRSLLNSGIRRGCSQESIDLPRQLHVAIGQAVSVMRGEQNIDTVVDVEPFRMMVRLFCQQRNLGHEPESTVKIIEAEAARDRISLRIIDPAGQIGESFLPFLFGQLRNHGNSPVWTFRMARLWR